MWPILQNRSIYENMRWCVSRWFCVHLYTFVYIYIHVSIQDIGLIGRWTPVRGTGGIPILSGHWITHFALQRMSTLEFHASGDPFCMMCMTMTSWLILGLTWFNFHLGTVPNHWPLKLGRFRITIICNKVEPFETNPMMIPTVIQWISDHIESVMCFDWMVIEWDK